MRYDPLADLFRNLLKAPVAPDVLVLMGPFVSVKHPVVKTGHITEVEGGEEVRQHRSSVCLSLLLEPFLPFGNRCGGQARATTTCSWLKRPLIIGWMDGWPRVLPQRR